MSYLPHIVLVAMMVGVLIGIAARDSTADLPIMTWEKCMKREMRNMPSSMYPVAKSICSCEEYQC